MWDDELLEGKVSKLTLLEFQELSKNNLTGFTRLNLAFHPSSNSTKARLIHDFTCNIKQTTLSLEFLTSEQCIGSLAEAQISFRMFHYIKWDSLYAVSILNHLIAVHFAALWS